MRRKLMITLRSFYVRYIKGNRNRQSPKELAENHYSAVIDSIPAMVKSQVNKQKAVKHCYSIRSIYPKGFIKANTYKINEYIAEEARS